MDFKIATTAMNPVTCEQYLCSHAGLTTGWRNHNMHSHETNAGILSDGLNEMLAHGEWYDYMLAAQDEVGMIVIRVHYGLTGLNWIMTR